MTQKDRYRLDPEYRARRNRANLEAYHKAKLDPHKLKMQKLRGRINNARDAIKRHEDRLEYFLRRIQKDQELLRKLKQKPTK